MKSIILIYHAFFWIISLNLLLPALCSSSKQWCWTTPSPSKSHSKDFTNSIKGGSNWGYCAITGPGSNENIPYRIYVDTSNLISAESSGIFYITLYGEENQTDEIMLTQNGFEAGSTTIVKILGRNVGDVVKLKLRNGGNDPYKCEKIRVELGAKFWDFDCNDYIACPKNCYDMMFLSGNQKYEVTVKTSNQLWADTKSPLYIQFIGIQGKTPKKVLTETGYERGDTHVLEIQTRDVSLLYGVVLSMTKSDMWIPEQIIVKRNGKEISVFNPKGQYLKCPLVCSLTLTNTKPGDLYASLKSSKEDEQSETTTLNGSTNEENSLFNDYLGGALTATEKQGIINLSCDTIIKNNEDFGPKYANGKGNFLMILAICPPGCYKTGESLVFGQGIHPQESSICKSAIVDNAMPLIGGVIGVGVVNGLEYYERANRKNGIEIHSFQNSAKSFFTYKVDNLDMAENDIRIVSNTGNPSYVGRLEFRLNGIWGTICSKGMTDTAAKVICQGLKFKTGKIKVQNSLDSDSSQSQNFCRNFKGEDFCGPEPMPIHYMSLRCEGSETEIMKCYREIPEENVCSHNDDVIIECSNVNNDLVESFEQGAVRIVDSYGFPTFDFAGRLEMYKEGSWGSVCNQKFNDKAAHVACRQMGFITGNVMGNFDKYGICSSFQGKNYCGSLSLPIHLNHVECYGSENSIMDCVSSGSPPEECSHEQDVIIQCSGNNGDPTAQSQKQTHNTIGPPYLGKLPMIPIINVKCTTKGNEQIFRGDPGSIFLVNCPENCVDAEVSIWGNGIYISDSSICKSAIHSGVLQNFGGLVEYIKAPGLAHYESGSNRGIISTNYGGWPSSFVISKPNSLAIKLSQAFGSKIPESKSFLQLKNKEFFSYHPNNFFKESKKTHKPGFSINSNDVYKTLLRKRKQTSLLQIEAVNVLLNSNLIKPVFQWIPPTPNFIFNGENTIVNTNELPGVEKTKTLQAFSLAVRFIMNRFPLKQQTIVSHSGCGGYALIINEDNELIFKARCTQNEFHTGYIMPLNHPLTAIFVYDMNFMLFYIDGLLFNRQAKQFQFKCDKGLDIGGFSELNDEYFNGEIYFVQIYAQALPYESIVSIIKNGAFLPNDQKIGRKYTTDGRLCISPCNTSPVPSKSSLASLNSPSNTANKLSESTEGISDSENIKAETNLQESDLITRVTSIQARCDILATDSRFAGPSGKKFRVNCPKGCLRSPLAGNVFGTTFYTDDSSVCKAAVHAGLIQDETGGDVIMLIGNGEESYQSSYQNGVQAGAHGPNPRSITFKPASQISRIDCYESAGSSRFNGPFGSKFTVFCEKDCSKRESMVFGDQIYTDDSSICQAAIHAGLLTDKGGEIQFIMEEGRTFYESSIKNGVQSQRRGTYLRSFRLIGDKANACNFFKETYSPSNIFHNWKVIDAKASVFGPSEWTFNTNPTQYGLAIRQSSLIQDSASYGTMLINKRFDCSDAEFHVNVYLTTSNMAVIFFRFYDANNYYALELNAPNSPHKIKLIKKLEGIAQTIAGNADAVFPRVWYRFKIIFQDANIQVFKQTGQLRNVELVINITDNDIQRGAVGFGTQGNAGAFFDGVEVKEIDKREKISEQRIWDQCLGANDAHRKKFCKSVFGGFSDVAAQCEKLHDFCELCCDSVVPRLEKVLNYGCWKQCVREAKSLEKRKQEEKLAEMEFKTQIRNEWKPSIDESVDYKPKLLGEKGYFVPAKIYDIDKKYRNEQSPKEIKLIIKFYLDEKPKSEEVIYPNPYLTKCGVMLTGRADC